MAEIITLKNHRPNKGNLIAASPLEFRRGDWHGGYTMLCTREESQRYEAHRLEAFKDAEHPHISFVPNHFTLSEGYHYTVQGLFLHRDDEHSMRRVYRLAGLMECITNIPSPILRTDVLRRFYQSILEERKALGVLWRGSIPQFLLPLHSDFYHSNMFRHCILKAETLKELYKAIEEETDDQFEILSRFYVFYVPKNFHPSDPHDLFSGTE
jgi:hypothetical protein